MNTSNTRNSKTYLEDILKKYEADKGGIYSGYLTKPTQGSIKRVCVLIQENDPSLNDQKIIDTFFNFNKDASITEKVRLIKDDPDRFRATRNFLRGETSSTSSEDFVALLVGFEERPLSAYLAKGKRESKQEAQQMDLEEPLILEESNITTTETFTEDEKLKASDIINTEQQDTTVVIDGDRKKKIKITIMIIAAMIVGVAIISYSNIIYGSNSEFMYWENDRFVMYNSESKALAPHVQIVPYDPVKFKTYRKINPDTLKNFKDKHGNVIIWYHKVNKDVVELFNFNGSHPEDSNINLIKMSEHMFDKHIKKDTNKLLEDEFQTP